MFDELKPCPFCGGDAHMDMHRSYRQLSGGEIGRAIAIYCLKCDVDMSSCKEDSPGEDWEAHRLDLIERWNRRAEASYSKFKFGNRVRKIKGSSWQGTIVGAYSTTLTPEGYCVESEREPGSVQIYPAQALEIVTE